MTPQMLNIWLNENKFVALQLQKKQSIMARELSTTHLNMYKAGGELSVLFERITDDPELSFELRPKDEVMVYYNKKKILTIKKGLKIEPLSAKYYEPGLGPTVDISDSKNWKNTKVIDKYLKEAKLIAYKKDMKREFQLQQNISLGNHDCEGRYLVVDMEWQFSQEKIAANDRIKKTRIDLIVVDLKPNSRGENDIYLTEVKLGTDALEGNSGLQGHVNSTHEIVCFKPACEALKDDVTSIITQKHELGIFLGKLPSLRLSNKPKMLFILGHRGSAERAQLEKAMSKLSIPPELDKPEVIYHDTLIKL